METATVAQSSFTIDCSQVCAQLSFIVEELCIATYDSCCGWQIAWMLNHGDGRSLFLIDEFGKGTAELDGVSLLIAVINYLATRKFEHARPRVILTTHFLVFALQKDHDNTSHRAHNFNEGEKASEKTPRLSKDHD
ncbi:hypothetical protein BBJ28_00005131 [Nothophytophthora sp. Chile5]|nr:hypothetical protein BBJ28_00005131 [Nothophytophthora sp. Chile5]